MALPTFVNAGTVASGVGTISPGMPASISTNDILLMFVETAGQAITVSGAGGGTWTQVPISPQSVGTSPPTDPSTRLTCFWSRYDGSQTAPTLSDSGNHQVGRIFAFRGCETSGNPWNVTSGGTEATSDTSISATGATTTLNDCLIVIAATTSGDAGADGTAEFSSWANTDLANVTERGDNMATAGNGGGLGVATGEKATAGAYGATTVTCATAGYHAFMTIALKEPQTAPTVALNSPADASSDSDTTPTLDFTGTDAEGDSVRYEVQVHTDSSFGSAPTVDSYDQSNQNNVRNISGDLFAGHGQSFTGDGSTLDSVQLMLKKVGSPTGNATVKIYAHTGTFGTSSTPTGSALATSDNLDVSTLTTSLTLTSLAFSGANRITLTNSTKYVVTIEYSGGDLTNHHPQVGVDDSSPTAAGNYSVLQSGSWTADSSKDLIFYVFGASSSPLLDKVSGTDSGFANPDNGGDTDPFNSGENIQFTVQAGDELAANTYYWRVRGIDPTGSNTYGAWSSTRSFTITSGGGTPTDKFFSFFPLGF